MVKLFLFTLGIVKATRHESSVCTAEDLLKISSCERRNGGTWRSDRCIEQVVGGTRIQTCHSLKVLGRPLAESLSAKSVISFAFAAILYYVLTGKSLY